MRECFRLFGYPDIQIRIFRIFGPDGHIFEAIKMKLYMSHLLGDADVLHFSDIPISEFGFFGYLTVKVSILKPLKTKNTLETIFFF